MDCSMPGFSVHHQILEFVQTHVHPVGDAIQLSRPLLSASPPAFKLFQHQGLLQWVSSSYQVAKVLELQLQHQSFQWIFRTDFFWVNWFAVLAVQGILKSLSQQHSSKASILWCSAFCSQMLYHWAIPPWCSTFFMAQLLHPYMTTGKIKPQLWL